MQAHRQVGRAAGYRRALGMGGWLAGWALALLVSTAPLSAQPPGVAGPPGGPDEQPEYPPFQEVLKGYEKIVSTADGSPSLYTLWIRRSDNQLLAELPKDYPRQRHFIGVTVASGENYAGLQAGEHYVYWRLVNKRLALIEPNIATRSTGDQESKDSVSRLFTDRVLLDIPVLTLSPQKAPIIDLDALLVGEAAKFFSARTVAGANARLATIKTVKAFPGNIEVAFELPVMAGQLKTLHYSISLIPDNTGYQPRVADQRVGYFTTSYTDLGKYDDDDKQIRFINRWHLEKADPSLKLSPPKEPIRFYIEHTTPKRYRHWVKQGILYWNTAFEKVGIRDAIEVLQQDRDTGAHMEKDPEDNRYNFVRWLNNDVSTAIGPSRVHPLTGQILDADIILTDGWIRHFEEQFHDLLPELAVDGFSPQTLAWLNLHPTWDPRILLASPAERPRLLAERARLRTQAQGGHPIGQVDPKMLGDDMFDGLIGRTSQSNGLCMAAKGKALDLAMLRATLDLWAATEGEPTEEEKKKQEEEAKAAAAKAEAEKKAAEGKPAAEGEKPAEEKKDEPKQEEPKKEEAKKDEPKQAAKSDEQMLDGMPESFIGPLLAELVAHEVGHTLGLRHNFKASSIYALEDINSPKVAGKPYAGSVMDYLPINIKVKRDLPGDHTMTGIGPYDFWAIEYGYSFNPDLKPILARVAEKELVYATDEDTWGPDPTARRYDFAQDPLSYGRQQMELAKYHRARLIDKFVKDGQSWDKARKGYELTLAMQMRSLSMMADWIGGTFVNRDKKGDPNGRKPVEVIPVQQQRDALKFVIDSSFPDEAYGLTPELLQHFSYDKWLDSNSFEAQGDWPVHDSVMGLQASVLTMLMNPDTLRLVYDNELRTPADTDVITLPELLDTISGSIWSELDNVPSEKASARKPWISSLRRNLQREHLQRMIDLTLPDSGWTAAYKPISNLALLRLQDLQKKLEKVLEQRAILDPYSAAHLNEAKLRVDKVLDAEFIYNVGNLGGGGQPILLFGEEPGANPPAQQEEK